MLPRHCDNFVNGFSAIEYALMGNDDCSHCYPTGCSSVPVDGFIRTRWAAMVNHEALRTAYALETVLDEIIFLVGQFLVLHKLD